MQEDSVNGREDGRIRADRESERENGYGGEPKVFRELAESGPEVLSHAVLDA
jgi:hypothetical protein